MNLLVCLVLMSADLAPPDGMPKPLTQGRYVAAGLAGTVVGFGLGHAIADEYQTMGYVFTIGEGASLAVAIVGAVTVGIGIIPAAFGSEEGQETVGNGAILFTAGWVGFGVFRVWEAIDIWTRPVVEKTEVKTEAPSTPSVQFSFLPVLGAGQTGILVQGQF